MSGKRIFNRFYSPLYIKSRLIHPFSRRYLVHILIIVVSVFVVASNLNAYEVKRDENNYSNIISAVIGDEELNDTFEEGPINTQNNKITRYLGEVAIEYKPQLNNYPIEQTSEPSTVTGGSAVVKPILSPTETNRQQNSEPFAYLVQNGDTVSSISSNFGVSANTILWENNLTAYSIIRPGQKLTILPVSGISYTVARGDNLKKIADKYKADQEQIIEYNKLASADDIQQGEKLIIPGGVKPQAAPVYAIRNIISPAVRPLIAIGAGMIWPNTCQRITQYYKWLHSGIDIACPAGSTIIAANAGKVIKAQGGWNGGYGNMIVIDHGGNMQTVYGHLNKIYVRVGDDLTKGQAIGSEGSTGRSTGPHLHFEVRLGGSRKNPLSYIK